MNLFNASGGADMRNLIIAVALSTAILVLWQVFYQGPQEQAVIAARQEEQARQAKTNAAMPVSAQPAVAQKTALPRAEALAATPRLPIQSEELHGSIALKGLRFDDLTLARYRETTDPKSPEVVLLSPAGTPHAYFAELGWLAAAEGMAMPDANTVWTTDAPRLTPDSPAVFAWENKDGVRFETQVTLDKHFMFTVTQRVINRSEKALALSPYGLVNRAFPAQHEKDGTMGQSLVLHEGPVGVFGDTLEEFSYADMKEQPMDVYPDVTGWLGFTDKYWLSAFAPRPGARFKATYQYYPAGEQEYYQVDYVSAAQSIPPGGSAEVTTHFFAGAKKVALLDAYAQQYGIPLFDRAVDFGSLYFLTKPIFLLLNYFYIHLGNFGVAILLLTVAIRLLLFPLANKSYKAMAQMKKLMPKINELRERYSDDKLKLNQEMIELYKREKVNPASGCLPMLIQLPVFFALYKVLFVTIEMRHAPFFGWIHDLSAKDPTNVFTLLDMIPWDPPAILHLGVWPILMTVTMVVQQKLSPKPTDPVQAQVMGMLPYLFLFMFASFPAGLVIYWAWNNILSILQQWVINRGIEAPEK